MVSITLKDDIFSGLTSWLNLVSPNLVLVKGLCPCIHPHTKSSNPNLEQCSDLPFRHSASVILVPEIQPGDDAQHSNMLHILSAVSEQ